MIRHVVMWKFRPGCEAEAEEFLERLRGLGDQLEMIRAMRVERDSSGKADHFDAVLIADFDHEQALAAYLSDPRHLAVSALCKSIREQRASVDYVWEPNRETDGSPNQF